MVRKLTFCDLVINGDTFWTTEPKRMRLANVCAPETGEPNFYKAKGTLERLILNKAIEYDEVSTSDEQTVVDVVVEGMSVNRYMQLAGYTCP